MSHNSVWPHNCVFIWSISLAVYFFCVRTFHFPHNAEKLKLRIFWVVAMKAYNLPLSLSLFSVSLVEVSNKIQHFFLPTKCCFYDNVQIVQINELQIRLFFTQRPSFLYQLCITCVNARKCMWTYARILYMYGYGHRHAFVEIVAEKIKEGEKLSAA